jgi:hypothetical protein
MQSGGRRDQVLEILRRSPAPLDDDQVAAAAQMNRVYVNAVCRRLAAEGLIIRQPGPANKVVNMAAVGGDQVAGAAITAIVQPHPRVRADKAELAAGRIRELVADFPMYVAAFEASAAFPGPSLYFHVRAIERRREHTSVGSLLDDRIFLEYVYAVLPAWGMHRMGPQPAKVADFTAIVDALRLAAPALEQLWPLRITTLDPEAAGHAAATAWDVISGLQVSTSRTQIVAGSKFLHHLLPDLIPPIDRRYTFSFFTGRTMVASDKAAFLDWFPQLAMIGAQCQEPIRDAINRGGFMATGEAKIIDNAIMGFMQRQRASPADDDDLP